MNKKYRSHCAVNSCNSSRYRTKTDIHFFSFPSDPERCKLWVKACDRDDLRNVEPEILRRDYSVCNLHFEDRMYLNFVKTRLNHVAVPVLFTKTQNEQPVTQIIEIKEEPVVSNFDDFATINTVLKQEYVQEECSQTIDSSTNTNSSIETLTSGTQTPMVLINHTPRTDKMRSEIKLLRTQLSRIKSKLMKIQNSTDADVTYKQFENSIHKFLPTNLAKFMRLQINLANKKSQGRRYRNEFMKFCISIYFTGPKYYKYLLKMFCLPTERTLQRFVEKIKFHPGFDDNILESVKIKVMHMKELDKYCILRIDETPVKSNLFYNITKDEIIGFTDNGNDKKFVPASQVAVLMISGLYSGWKLPVSYIFRHSPWEPSEMKNYLIEYISKLQDIGLHVKGVVSNNIPLTKVLQITPENSFFNVHNKKIYYFFSASYLIRASRNNFILNSFVYNNCKTSWKYVEFLYETDKKLQYRLAPKLTDSHVKPNSVDKMEVKYATEVLSGTVAAALNTYISLGALTSEAEMTVQLIDKFDKLFGILNSSTYIGDRNQEQFLTEALHFFDNVSIVSNSNANITDKMKCISGWKITINSILNLWADLKTVGFEFLHTERINPKPLEIIFGKTRHQTPFQICNLFKKSFCENLFICNEENCGGDLANVLTKISDYSKDEILETTVTNKQSITIQDCDYRNTELPEQNALGFMCNYLINKCLFVHNCYVCNNYANAYFNSNNLALFNNFNLVSYVEKLENCFLENFETIAIHPDIIKNLINKIELIKFGHPCDKFPYDYFLKLYCRMRLFYTLKFINKNFKTIKGRNKSIILNNVHEHESIELFYD